MSIKYKCIVEIVKHSKLGFTLVELLIVVTIIGVLTAAAATIFRGVSGSARDAKRREDVDALAKAYEMHRTLDYKYQPLDSSYFDAGGIPKDPARGDYFNWLAADKSGFKICATLENNSSVACNTPAANCYCKVSTQGAITTREADTGGSTHGELGFGSSGTSSCNPDGTLLNGALGYWKFDQNTQDTMGSYNGTWFGTPNYKEITMFTRLQFKFAGNFNGSSYISTDLPISKFSNGFSWSAWVRTNNLTGSWSWVFSAEKMAGDYFGFFQCGKKQGDGNIRFETGDFTDHNTLDTPIHNIADNSWHLLTCIWDKTNEKKYIYIDEQKAAEASAHLRSTTKAEEYGKLLIGRQPTYNEYWTGFIDNVIVYNRALSPQEITTLYSGNQGKGCIP